MNSLVKLLILSLLFSACGSQTDKNEGKKVFRYNESSGITSLDPAFSSNQANIWACNHLFNGLVQLNDELMPQPCIAKKYSISEDGMTYTFHLQTNVAFHKDSLFRKTRFVVANDFVFSFSRIANEDLASPGAWIFNAVLKDENGKATGFKAINDSTFQITLAHTFPPFLGLLGSSYGAVVPWEVVKKYGKDFRNHPIGTGPFLFHKWYDRQALILHKNENYFEYDATGVRLPYLDAVMVSFISDKQSAFLEFLKGNLDFISGLDVSYKDDLLTPDGKLRAKYKGKIVMQTGPYLNTEYLGILADSTLPIMKDNPLNNLKIRQAINYGFDRKKMIKYLRNDMAYPGIYGMVPFGTPGFNDTTSVCYNYNPQKAQQLLKEAGYPNGNGLPTIVMSTTASYQDLCEYIQSELATLGIKIKLEVNQAAQHRQMVAKQQLTFFRGSWIADYGDAENYLSLFYSPNKSPIGPNYTHYSNAAYDKMYNESMSIANDSARWNVYRKMDQLMMQESPVIILYYDKVLRLTHNTIHSLTMNPMNVLKLKRVKID